jgi:RNA polymerase sigma factor (sigma-70 family)
MYDMEAALDVQENSDATRSAAVGALFEAHGRDVYRFVSRRLGASMAQDVTAEAFRIVFERWEQYTPELGSDRAWLFGVASNVIRRHLRSEQRRFSALERLSAVEQVSPEDGVDTDGRIDSAGEARRVLSAVSRLDPDDRDLLILVAWEGLSYRDAGDALGLPPGTVGSRLNRIRKHLQSGESQ